MIRWFLPLFLLSVVLLPGERSLAQAERILPSAPRAAPFLLAPCTEDVRLPREGDLVFRWRPSGSMINIKGYQLQVFTGYQTVTANLLLSENISGPQQSVALPVTNFVENQVYSWLLTEVYLDGRKSDRGYCSFITVDGADTRQGPVAHTP